MSDERFRTTSRGYDRAEVDAMRLRIERTLAGVAGADAVTASDVRASRFAIRMRGYDPSEVDTFLEEAMSRLPEPTHAAPVAAEASATSWTESLREQRELLQVAGHPADRRFQRSRFRKGYATDEVDAFVDQVRSTLTTTLTGDDVRNVQFTERLGGYDQAEVDAWLDAVEAHARR